MLNQRGKHRSCNSRSLCSLLLWRTMFSTCSVSVLWRTRDRASSLQCHFLIPKWSGLGSDKVQESRWVDSHGRSLPCCLAHFKHETMAIACMRKYITKGLEGWVFLELRQRSLRHWYFLRMWNLVWQGSMYQPLYCAVLKSGQLSSNACPKVMICVSLARCCPLISSITLSSNGPQSWRAGDSEMRVFARDWHLSTFNLFLVLKSYDVGGVLWKKCLGRWIWT